MDEVGIRLKLETGDAVANANQATQAIDSLGKALEKAAIAGNAQGVIDYANALTKYKGAVGLQEAKTEEASKPTILRVVEDANKIIAKAPGYIGAMGGGNAAGAALNMASGAVSGAKALSGATLGTGAMVGLGVGAAILGVAVAANKLSEQWEKQIPQVMDLTAVLGKLTGDYRTNSIEFQRAFNLAAQAATKFGYSVEEGMATVSQLAKLGVSTKGMEPYTAAERVYAYERGTGAERETLMRAEAYAARYNAGPNALGYALGGTYAQGLETAQFQEYLNATLRIFEEGLSRGVIKGFDEITRTQNFIALLGKGSPLEPLFKGEQGARLYETMNEPFKQAAFESQEDVIRYRATEAVLKEAAAHQFRNESGTGGVDWSIYKQYGDITKEGYLAVQRARQDAGLTPEIFKQTMDIIKNITQGSYELFTEEVIKAFNLKYIPAQQIINAYNAGTPSALANAYAVAAAPTSAASQEMTLLQATNEIKVALANAGEAVLPAKVELMSVLRGILNGIVGNKVVESYKKEIPSALGTIYTGSPNDALAKAAATKILNAGLNEMDKGPDINQNGIGDNAEAAIEIIKWIESRSNEERRYLIASGALTNIWDKKTVNDLPSIAKYLAQGQYKTKEWTQGYEEYISPKPVTYGQAVGMTDIFNKYAPDWPRKYEALPMTFIDAVMSNNKQAADIYKWIMANINNINSSAVKDADKDKAIRNFLSDTLTKLNTAMENAMTEKSVGGKAITEGEWADILKKVFPSQSKANENMAGVQLSRAERAGGEILGNEKGFNREFSALFAAAQQKSISEPTPAINWNDFAIAFAHILNEFTINNNAAAEKIAKAADKIAEPTELVIAAGNTMRV
jgi:hypothetical protein